jgi:RNA polymerase sigma-70 factor (ECF subfamily)
MITITELYEEHAAGLRRFANSLAHDADQADDLVSETFLQAMAYLHLLGTLASHQRKAWLFRVLKNRFIDQFRTNQRQAALVNQMAWVERLSAPAPFSQEVLAQVPLRYRELLHMSYILGMTSEEIGAKLGVPAATVRSRLRMAIQWLRAHQTNFE